MQTRRSFFAAAGAPLLAAAAQSKQDDISLAAWSLVRSFRKGRWTIADLPRICREDLYINGVELVNQFFGNVMQRNVKELKDRGRDYGVDFVLIMIDGEGDMVAADAQERKLAAISHRKWVDIAHYLGCHAVRCNLGGPRRGWEAQTDEIIERAAESFHDLLEYSEDSGLSVLIENHGGASSDPKVLPEIMKRVDHPRFGTLPDFGNLNPDGDPYEVTARLMPWAQGVSVKASWNVYWRHEVYDLERLISSAKRAGYTGYWGIESGVQLREKETWERLSSDEVWERETRAVKMTRRVIQETLDLKNA